MKRNREEFYEIEKKKKSRNSRVVVPIRRVPEKEMYSFDKLKIKREEEFYE